MPRDYKAYLDDILQAIARIRRATCGVTYDEFAANEEKTDAVVRNLQVIGEAAKKIPDAIRSAHPEVEWKRIAGLRDIVVHDYFGIDLEVIWDVVRSKLPELDENIRRLL